MRYCKNHILFAVILVAAFFIGGVQAQTSEDVLAELQKRYDDLLDLEVSFEQQVYSGVFASTQKTSGKMYLAKGDKFRMQTEDQTIVSDGKLLWVYSKENEQVTIDRVSKTADLVRPSDYLFTFRESYSATLLPDTVLGKIECRRVELVSDEKDEFIQRMTLFVGRKDLLTHRAEYIDINGNRVEIVFKDLKIDKGLKPETFNFKTPKGVEEIRLP